MNLLEDRLKLALGLFLTFIVAWLVFDWVGTGRFVELVKSADIGLLSLAVVLHFFNVVLAALRLKFLEPSLDVPAAFFGTGIGLFLSDFTPARSGFLFSVEYLRSSRLGRSRLLKSILVGQTLDFALKGIFLILLLSFFSDAGYILSPALFFLLLLISGGVIVSSRRAIAFVRRFSSRIPVIGNLISTYALNTTRGYTFTQLVLSFAATAGGWAFVAARWIIGLSALHIQVNVLSFVILYSVLVVLNFLPTIGGFGGAELGLLFVGIAGTNTTELVVFAVVDRVVYVLTDTIIGLAAFIRKYGALR